MKDLMSCVNLLSGDIWPCGDIDPAEVMREAELDNIQEKPWTVIQNEAGHDEGATHHNTAQRIEHDRQHRDTHLQRIAYFVKNGIPQNDPEPVIMGVETLTLGLGSPEKTGDENFRISGRHRLAAAVIRGDSTLEIGFDGDQGIVHQILPNAIEVPSCPIVNAPRPNSPHVPTRQLAEPSA